MLLISDNIRKNFFKFLVCSAVFNHQIMHLVSSLNPQDSGNYDPCEGSGVRSRPNRHKTYVGNLHKRKRISERRGCDPTQVAYNSSQGYNGPNANSQPAESFGDQSAVPEGNNSSPGGFNVSFPTMQEAGNFSNPELTQPANTSLGTSLNPSGSAGSPSFTQDGASAGDGSFNQSLDSASALGDNGTLSYFGPNGTESSEPAISQIIRNTAGLGNVFAQNAMQKNSLYLGFLPDDGSSGGTRQTMAQLNSDLGTKSAAYGWYSQAHSGTTFDGSQLLAVIDDVKACNCVFQPAVMPVGGWQGLTPQDNSQAVAIAQVMKKFTDEGIPVWLRFAHEMNYYQTDGTYQGNAQDFKAGWASVSAAIKQIAPDVKMWWTPNVASADNYASYEPDDMGTVDLVGIDYYPKKLTGNDFLPTMKGFHDKYAVNGRKFAIGETGLGWAGSTDDKQRWLAEICTAKSSLPQFLSMAWFNFDKEYDYKIAGEPSLDQKFTSFLAV